MSIGEGNGNPLQHSCLENSMDRNWWATVHWVAKSRPRLSTSTYMSITRVHRLFYKGKKASDLLKIIQSPYQWLDICHCSVYHLRHLRETLLYSFGHWVMSDSLWPRGLQHTRLPYSSVSLGVAQTHVHWVGDTIQPSHSLLSPSPPAVNLSQHQGLFKWVSSSHQVAKVLEFQLQHQTFQGISRTDFL